LNSYTSAYKQVYGHQVDAYNGEKEMDASAKRIRRVYPTVQQMAKFLRREMTPEVCADLPNVLKRICQAALQSTTEMDGEVKK